MKRFVWVGSFLILAIIAGPTRAQVFYAYPDAAVTQKRKLVAGPYLSLGDGDLFRLGGYSRYGVGEYFDAGLEVVVDTAHRSSRAGVGGDLKFTLVPHNHALPFDVSANLGIGFLSGDKIAIVQVPIGAIVSSPFELDSGQTVVPYLGVYVLIVDQEFKRKNAPNLSDTDIDVELRGGARYALREDLDMFATIHLGRDTSITVGMNFSL